MKAQIDEKMNRRSVIEISITHLSASIVELEKKAQIVGEELDAAKQAKTGLEDKITAIEEYLSSKNKQSELARTELNLLQKDKGNLEQTESKI